MKFDISKEWLEKRIPLEDGCSIEAGYYPKSPVIKLDLSVFENHGIPLHKTVQKENGSTLISLENAYYFLSFAGEPKRIELIETEDNTEYFVDVSWKLDKNYSFEFDSDTAVFRFTGFVCGCCGVKVDGFEIFLKALGLNDQLKPRLRTKEKRRVIYEREKN
jgi:hypothetical protein